MYHFFLKLNKLVNLNYFKKHLKIMLEILQILVHKSYTLRLFSLFTMALVILIIMSIYKHSLVKSLKLLSIIFLQTKINYILT